MNETELQDRDDRLANALKAAEEQARILEDEAQAARRNATQIRRAIENGRWWELSGVVSEADIESLCECSPMAQNIFES